MSISSEIERLQGAKNTLKTKINAKNDEQHQITNETIDEYGDFVDSISGGSGSSINFFIQDEQPEGYDGIWIEDSTYANYPIVEINNMNSLVANSINILKGTNYSTILCDNFSYTFDNIVITDNSGNEISNIDIYYGSDNQWSSVIFYTTLEYAQNDGTDKPYIDTRILGNSSKKMECKLEYISGTGCGFGFMANNYGMFAEYGGSPTKLSFYVGQIVYGNFHDAGAISNYKQPLTITISNTSIIVKNYDEIVKYSQSFSAGSFNSNVYIYAFGRNTGSLNNPSGVFKIYYLKIYDNNVLVRDMIPVKDKNNVVCFYDKISGTFFYNAGSGSFTAGPEV